MKFNKLIPELSVSDFEKSLNFYTKILGFKVEYKREEDKFAFLSFQESQIMIEQNNDKWKNAEMKHPFGRGVNLQIEVNNVNTIIALLKRNKHPLFGKLKESWYRKDNLLLGNKEVLVQDPDGYLLRFFQDIGSKPIKS